jgi:hypothetical protein
MRMTGSLARLASGALALTVFAAGFAYPYMLPPLEGAHRAATMLVLLGMSLSIIHASGIRIDHPALRFLASPWTAWPLTLGAGRRAFLF